MLLFEISARGGNDLPPHEMRKRQILAASPILQPENNSECEPLLECDPIAHCRPQPPVLFRFAHRRLVEPFEPTRSGHLCVPYVPVGADENVENESAFLRE